MSNSPAILLVDDDDVFLTVVESMVQMLGLPVMKAHNGIEAITIFKEHANDIGCVILDIHMPRMNGIETFRYLKEMRENVQVIIVSGYLDEANLAQINPLHPAGNLQKPITFQTLSALLVKCLPTTDFSKKLT
ncbi:MAG: response regulator [Desulforhopalus sp.]